MQNEAMDLAIQEAQKARELGEVPVGAVVVRDGEVVSAGYNQRERNSDPLGHAELVVIKEASKRLGSWRLTGCQLYVTLEPCPMCLAACQQARVAEVIYGAEDKKGGALSLGYPLHKDERTNHRFEARFEARPECGEILTEFFKDRRRGRA